MTRKLVVGLNGLTGWGPAEQKRVEAVTRVKRDRLNVADGSNLTWLRDVCATGCVPLVLYDPGLKGRPTPQISADIRILAAAMRALGLTQLEFGNEVYFHGTRPTEYAAQYKAAHEALEGSGITLIANGYGDYQRPDGSWSQVEGGKGWCVDFVRALVGVPDAWSFHPYGPMTSSAFEGSGAKGGPGWLSVPRIIANLKEHNIHAPVHITEVGQSTNNDPGKEVTPAAQALAVRQYVRQAAEWGVASIYLFCAFDPYGKPGFGLYTAPASGVIGPAKPSAAVLGGVVASLTSTGKAAS